MDTTLLSIIASIAAALGIKELWTIWKKKIDIKAGKQSEEMQLSTKVFFTTISDLKDEIKILESKIDMLITENTELKVKIGIMETQLLENAVKKSKRKVVKTVNKNKIK